MTDSRLLLVVAVLCLTGCDDRAVPPTEKTDSVARESVKDSVAGIDDFSALLQPASAQSVWAEDDYHVWGGSVVKGQDGLYHLYYSRWKQQYGFNAWVTHSEIAHAVSSAPGGPFDFVDIALPPRGTEFWDGLTTHNPTVHEIDGTYYLYYMGTTGDGKATDSLNFTHRNNQRIGVAVAADPNGPWHRQDRPLIDVSAQEKAYDALMVSNPSLTVMKDGTLLMIYKAVAKHKPLPFGGPVTHRVAVADTPVGPFTKLDRLVFYRAGEMFPAEDPYIWYQRDDDLYYALVKDMQGTFTGAGPSLAFFRSENGLDWVPAENALAARTAIRWDGGTVQQVARLERPQLLFENGQPVMLYVAVLFAEPGRPAVNVPIPLKRHQETDRKNRP